MLQTWLKAFCTKDIAIDQLAYSRYGSLRDEIHWQPPIVQLALTESHLFVMEKQPPLLDKVELFQLSSHCYSTWPRAVALQASLICDRLNRVRDGEVAPLKGPFVEVSRRSTIIKVTGKMAQVRIFSRISAPMRTPERIEGVLGTHKRLSSRKRVLNRNIRAVIGTEGSI
jgi:hypothetical protein